MVGPLHEALLLVGGSVAMRPRLPNDLMRDPQWRHSLIPGGAHTYSRGDDVYPACAPPVLVRGKGAHVWDLDDRCYLDWGMGLRSVILGYADERVDGAVSECLSLGVNLSRPVPEEFQLAELLTECIPSAEMVKFGKNGSDATSAAIRLSRAYTGRNGILRCADDPFLGVHDWFIGSTVMNRGIPEAVSQLTRGFLYGSMESVAEAYAALLGDVSAIILEPVGLQGLNLQFLTELSLFAKRHSIVLIFDETITGFRLAVGGAQEFTGVSPDLSTFGKGIANGFALSALAGRRDIMKLGGFDHNEDRVFLMSSTYGSERVGLAAGLKTLEVTIEEKVPNDLSAAAERLMSGFSGLVDSLGLNDLIRVGGTPLLPRVDFQTRNGCDDPWLKTLFQQEMLNDGILIPPYFASFAQAHGGPEIDRTLEAMSRTLASIEARASSTSFREFVNGHPVRKVFRRRNADL